ncbi:MAG: AAA family ATPase [Proteobacteria bacterium]|nr:AAA family ATPase [Pseudomonadota bacterium]
MYNRLIKLPQHPTKSFYLWGPRQVGKSFELRRRYPDATTINLLKSDEFADYQSKPQLLRERAIQNKWKFVIIDEIQKVPQLLDEVHYLIEEYQIVFALCGSSARKLKSSHANLLGGRALRFEMNGLVSVELGDEFNLSKLLQRGYIPSLYDSDQFRLLQKSYCADYLKEEVFAEGLVRKLAPFSRFLEISALGDTEVVSYETIARDCGISSPTVKSYYSILADTLIGRYLPSYSYRPKRRITLSPKFYYFDVGIVNYLAQRGDVLPKSEAYGKAFENWVHHEIVSWIEYHQRTETLSYWQLSHGIEVDFIIGHMLCAIEAKATDRVRSDHLKGLRELSEDHPEVKRRMIVSLEPISRRTEDGIEIVSVSDFLRALWEDKII